MFWNRWLVLWYLSVNAWLLVTINLTYMRPEQYLVFIIIDAFADAAIETDNMSSNSSQLLINYWLLVTIASICDFLHLIMKDLQDECFSL